MHVDWPLPATKTALYLMAFSEVVVARQVCGRGGLWSLESWIRALTKIWRWFTQNREWRNLGTANLLDRNEALQKSIANNEQTKRINTTYASRHIMWINLTLPLSPWFNDLPVPKSMWNSSSPFSLKTANRGFKRLTIHQPQWRKCVRVRVFFFFLSLFISCSEPSLPRSSFRRCSAHSHENFSCTTSLNIFPLFLILLNRTSPKPNHKREIKTHTHSTN